MTLRDMAGWVFDKSRAAHGLTRYRVLNAIEEAYRHYHRDVLIPEASPYGPLIEEEFTWTSGTSHDPTSALTYFRSRIEWIKSTTYDDFWEPETIREIERLKNASAYLKRGALAYALDGHTIHVATALAEETVTIKHYMWPPTYGVVLEADEDATFAPFGRDLTASPLFPLQFHELICARAALSILAHERRDAGKTRFTDDEKRLEEQIVKLENKLDLYVKRQLGKIHTTVASIGAHADAYYHGSAAIRR